MIFAAEKCRWEWAAVCFSGCDFITQSCVFWQENSVPGSEVWKHEVLCRMLGNKWSRRFPQPLRPDTKTVASLKPLKILKSSRICKPHCNFFFTLSWCLVLKSKNRGVNSLSPVLGGQPVVGAGVLISSIHCSLVAFYLLGWVLRLWWFLPPGKGDNLETARRPICSGRQQAKQSIVEAQSKEPQTMLESSEISWRWFLVPSLIRILKYLPVIWCDMRSGNYFTM